MARARIEWVDIAKGIGIILVIFGHSLATGSTLRQLIFSFHMPLFFLLAGCTFRQKGFRQLACASAKALLVPYCLLFFAWRVTRWLAGLSGGVATSWLVCLRIGHGRRAVRLHGGGHGMVSRHPLFGAPAV